MTRLAAGQGSSVTQAHPRRPAKPTAVVMGGRGAGGISFESGKQESNWKFFLQAFLLFYATVLYTTTTAFRAVSLPVT